MFYSCLIIGVDAAEVGSSSETLEGNIEGQAIYYGFSKF